MELQEQRHLGFIEVPDNFTEPNDVLIGFGITFIFRVNSHIRDIDLRNPCNHDMQFISGESSFQSNGNQRGNFPTRIVLIVSI